MQIQVGNLTYLQVQLSVSVISITKPVQLGRALLSLGKAAINHPAHVSVRDSGPVGARARIPLMHDADIGGDIGQRTDVPARNLDGKRIRSLKE